MDRRWVVLVLGMSLGALAHARLPAPTAEQAQIAEQKKAEEAEKARAEQEALTRVQDRIAAQFGKGQRTATAPTEPGKMPMKAIEAKGAAGPQGGVRQSAEAHSAPAR